MLRRCFSRRPAWLPRARARAQKVRCQSATSLLPERSSEISEFKSLYTKYLLFPSHMNNAFFHLSSGALRADDAEGGNRPKNARLWPSKSDQTSWKEHLMQVTYLTPCAVIWHGLSLFASP